DLAAQSWDSLRRPGMPYIGMMLRRKKSKDGGSAVLQDGRIFALKGGNTQEFWMYDPGTSEWTELDTMPAWGSTGRKKRVKYGADIVSFGDGAFFALKGNKTSEFWRYVMPYAAGPRPSRSGIMGAVVKSRVGHGFELRPNPLVDGIVTVTWQFADAPLSLRGAQRRGNPGAVAISVFDIAGRAVSHTWSLGHSVSGSVSLDLRTLAAGIYLVQLDADGLSSSQKLVLDR
ncbi:MAG: T9SS type A sorting domain-containing protein, partial [candidate division WOR-3 bacterium]